MVWKWLKQIIIWIINHTKIIKRNWITRNCIRVTKINDEINWRYSKKREVIGKLNSKNQRIIRISLKLTVWIKLNSIKFLIICTKSITSSKYTSVIII